MSAAVARPPAILKRIRAILASARAGAARTVNRAHVISCWLIGREIYEEEQRGAARAGYGEEMLRGLSEKLGKEYGAGYSYGSLKLMRQFYVAYGDLLDQAEIGYAARGQSEAPQKGHALRGLSRASTRLRPAFAGRQSTLGLILCADKKHAVVRYTLGPEQAETIFASRYKLRLPTETELKEEVRREVRELTAGDASKTRPRKKR